MKNKNYFTVKSVLTSWLCCLTVCLGLWTTSSKAQLVATYDFAQLSGTYTSIGSGTSALGASIDDAPGTAQSIGFNFTYHGTVFTQFVVQSNGYIGLGASVTQSYSPLSGVPNCISFAGGDGRSGPSGVYYAVSGSAPNRVLTIEEPSHYFYYGTNADHVDVQVKLYETANMIQILYNNPVNTGAYTRQVGLTGAAVSDFAVRTTTTNWSATTLSGANSGTMTLSSTVFPAAGQVYSWSPHLTYCVPSVSVQDEHIINVTMGSINSSTAYSAGGYGDYSATTNTSLTIGNAASISVNTDPYYGSTDVVSVWIDYNHSGTFDVSEITTLPSAAALMTGTITAPGTALWGATRMRVRESYNTSPDACSAQTYGEVEDYTVTVVPATGCAGTPAASTTISNANPTCSGVNFTLSLGTVYSLGGITYQWQSADDAAFTV
ncbi:MAG: GEVED domain-containing protein, partial [Bacteroidota bacterium]